MKRTFSDRRSEVVLDPRDFLIRLCARIPPTRFHRVRYFGAFAPCARDRAALTGQRAKKPADVPPSGEPPAPAPRADSSACKITSDERPPAEDHSLGAPPPDPNRPPRLDWAALLQRVHKIDVFACPCGGRREVIAFLTDPRLTRKILQHLGIDQSTPVARPARPPPQRDLFAADRRPDDPFVDPGPPERDLRGESPRAAD